MDYDDGIGTYKNELLQIYNISNNKQRIIDITKSKLSKKHPNVEFKQSIKNILLKSISDSILTV